MKYCNVRDILDKALSKVPDNSSELRVKALGWLEEVVSDIAAQPRSWKFLETKSVLTVTASEITIPDDFNQLIGFEVDGRWLDKNNQLTDEEAELYTGTTYYTPLGYTSKGGTITIIPTTTVTTCDFYYEPQLITALTDDTSDTIFPYIFRNLLITGVRMHYYDYDKDGRYTKETMLYENEMYKVKAWDNQQKTLPQSSRHGYLK